jgi:hypothetical protein
MKRVLILASVAEAATGSALIIEPSMVGRLLLGDDLTAVAISIARLTGIALIALGIACWPGPPRLGMMIYNAAATLYLASVGFAGFGGMLLWPAVIVHLLMTILLLWPSGKEPNAPNRN